MNFNKKISLGIIICSLLMPYTAFAENSVEYETIQPSDIQLFENTPEHEHRHEDLTDEDKELFDYIISQYHTLARTITIPEEYNINPDHFLRVYEEYMGKLLQYEHPELFYVFGRIKTEFTSDRLKKVFVEYTLSDEEIKEANEIIDDEILNITQHVSGMNDFEKVLFVHDYIVANYEYDTRVLDDDPDTDGNRTLDAMVREKRGVCQGYSYLFKSVMDRLGIPCETVPSTELAHMWNKVNVNGSWYNIDVTYDDPILDEMTLYSPYVQYHEYFLVSDDHLKELDPSAVDENGVQLSHHCTWNEYKWDEKTPATVSAEDHSNTFINELPGPTALLGGKLYYTERGDVKYIDFRAQSPENVMGNVYKIKNNEVWIQKDQDNHTFRIPLGNVVFFEGNVYFNSASTVYKINTDDYANPEIIYDLAKENSNRQDTDCISGLILQDGDLYAEYLNSPIETIEDEDSGGFYPVKMFPDSVIKILSASPKCQSSIKSDDEGNITVTLTIPEELKTQALVRIAEYDKDGAFIGFANIEDGSSTVTITPSSDIKCVKAFIWSQQNKPFARASEYRIDDTQE